MTSRQNFYENWGAPERIAAWAAATGFGISALLMNAYRDAVNSAWGLFDQHAPIQAAFALLWPTSILLRGAQSSQGLAILFLLSAALNAAYFVFVSLTAFLLYEKMESGFPASNMSVAAVRAYSAPKLMRHSKSTYQLD